MLRNRKEPKHLPPRKELPKRTKSECSKENSDANVERRDEMGFKRLHKNACRTKVCQFLEYRSERMNRLKNPSMWLISKTYLKKLDQVQNNWQPEEENESLPKLRKISWSEEAEYVYFNQRKSSASISSSERHTFFLEES